MALATLQTKQASPDFTLLLTQLENELIKGHGKGAAYFESDRHLAQVG